MDKNDIVIVSAKRTPMGGFQGDFNGTSAAQLGSAAIKAALETSTLKPEDIERIVSTYRKRESIEKFSHVAELGEVAENDYNLNIPRYVDTFEEEEAVGLAEVSEKLVTLENEMGETDKVIAGFCEELGIKAPF
jgi:type I restriction enzyme M protein